MSDLSSTGNALIAATSTLLAVFITQRFQVASLRLAAARARDEKIIEIKLTKMEESYFIFHKWVSSVLNTISHCISYCKGEIDDETLPEKIEESNLLISGDHEKLATLLEIYFPELHGIYSLATQKASGLAETMLSHFKNDNDIKKKSKEELDEIIKEIRRQRKEFLDVERNFEDEMRKVVSTLLSLRG